jgi:hypothetical protein
LTGKSFFFKSLDASCLNMLQNTFSIPEAHKNVFKNIEEKSSSQLDNSNDLLGIKFPVDNSQFNFMIIDANLGISDNLKNIFFLEFDLTNSNNKEAKILREINQEFVDKEIFFNLNVLIFIKII